MRMGRIKECAQGFQRIERQFVPERIGKSAENRPILAPVAGREIRPIGLLHAALRVDIGAGFFGVCCARQDDVGARRAPIAVRALIDYESARFHRDLIGAQKKQNIERAAFRHRSRVKSALSRYEAEIEATHPRRGRVQDREAVPPLLDDPERVRSLGHERQYGAPASRARAPWPIKKIGFFIFAGGCSKKAASVSGPAPR